MTGQDTPQVFTECNAGELLAQVGKWNLMAISGFRVERRPTGVTLPVSPKWEVTIDLAAGDTYTVRRVRRYNPMSAEVVGERREVYCEEVGELAYQASCFVNVAFGADDPDTEPGLRDSGIDEDGGL